MRHHAGEQVLSYPISSPAALEAPVVAAAGRDGRASDDAEQMILGRSPNPHLAFGAGAHSCLGQALARTGLQVVLEVPVDGLAVGGLRELPVRR